MTIENQLRVLRGAGYAVQKVLDVWTGHPDDEAATFRTLEVLDALQREVDRAHIKAAEIIANDFDRARARIAGAGSAAVAHRGRKLDILDSG